jgi:hypothetical protein
MAFDAPTLCQFQLVCSKAGVFTFSHTHTEKIFHIHCYAHASTLHAQFFTHTHALIFSEMLDWRPWCIHAIYAYIFCIFVIVKYTFIMQPPIFTDYIH